MKIIQMPLGMIQANCYLVITEQKNALVVDPGGEAERILETLEKEGATLRKILLTHGHHDHIAAVWTLARETNAEIYIHQEDGEMLTNIEISLCSMTGLYFEYDPKRPFHTLQDGDQVTLDELKLTLIHTPGHSKGSSCYCMGQVLFTGDTLFDGAVGRADLYGGNSRQLRASLKKLAALPGDYSILPGHEGTSTMEVQRQVCRYMRWDAK